jgi:hypothetical protein
VLRTAPSLRVIAWSSLRSMSARRLSSALSCVARALFKAAGVMRAMGVRVVVRAVVRLPAAPRGVALRVAVRRVVALLVVRLGVRVVVRLAPVLRVVRGMLCLLMFELRSLAPRSGQ